VIATPGLRASARDVAVAVAYHVNMQTGVARPSVATLAAEIASDDRTAQRGLRDLEAAGLLTVEHPEGRACCTYRPTNPGKSATVQPRQICQGPVAPTPANRVANPGNLCRQPRQICHPNRVEQGEQGRGAHSRRFTPPTVEAVSAYCLERANGIDPQRFVDHYEAKGWRIGKSPVKDWKACVRTWEARDRASKPASEGAGLTFTERIPTAEEALALLRGEP
jgi:hypothetical protein